MVVYLQICRAPPIILIFVFEMLTTMSLVFIDQYLVMKAIRATLGKKAMKFATRDLEELQILKGMFQILNFIGESQKRQSYYLKS
jgi:hypothetical protein